VSRTAAIGCSLFAALGLAGCFYVEEINQRPSANIRAVSSDPVHRGDKVELDAVASDPEGHVLGYTWRTYACTDATQISTCDREPFYFEESAHASFLAPILRWDNEAPVESLRIVLEVRDELGATAKPMEELVIPVLNAPPTLKLDRTSRYGYVVGTPIDLFALVGDVDDNAAKVKPLVWEVFGPGGATHTLIDLTVGQPADPMLAQFGKRFTPMQQGMWEIRVTARDPLDAEAVQTLMFSVEDDGPPCLQQLSPIVPTGGNAVPISAQTLFQVPVVIDDLDIYPPVPADPVLGTTRFKWSLQAPGETGHTEVAGAVGNSFAIDPLSYAPGDVLELRVEIFDRKATAIPCVDSEPTCAVVAQPAGCNQRQTWRVEVR
jgi:hypothetical protein